MEQFQKAVVKVSWGEFSNSLPGKSPEKFGKKIEGNYEFSRKIPGIVTEREISKGITGRMIWKFLKELAKEGFMKKFKVEFLEQSMPDFLKYCFEIFFTGKASQISEISKFLTTEKNS